jgi:hypothetical protein
VNIAFSLGSYLKDESSFTTTFIKEDIMKKLLSTALVLAALSAPALASAFWPGTVIGIAPSDQLNVRAWPASYSTVIDSYDNGDNVSLTGTCKNTVTNVSFSITGSQSTGWKHNKMKKPNVWCKVMTSSAQLGWVRGKYVWPE